MRSPCSADHATKIALLSECICTTVNGVCSGLMHPGRGLRYLAYQLYKIDTRGNTKSVRINGSLVTTPDSTKTEPKQDHYKAGRRRQTLDSLRLSRSQQ